MNEQLNRLRKLAGIINESPPVTYSPDSEVYGFDSDDADKSAVDTSPIKPYNRVRDKVGDRTYEPSSPKDAKAAAGRGEAAGGSDPANAEFIPYSPEKFKSTAKVSVANRISGGDENDINVKKDTFFKELVSAPTTLLGEINARLGNDENSLAVSDRLSGIMSQLQDKSITQLPEDDRTFVIKLVANAVKNMDLAQGDTDDYQDDEEDVMDSVDLSSIRDEYGINEDDDDFLDKYPGEDDEFDNKKQGHSYDDDDDEVISRYKKDAYHEEEELEEQAVEETANNAFEASIAQLRKLAGLA
jgi:hypothetical protein